jgi:Uma2 family endonuclease
MMSSATSSERVKESLVAGLQVAPGNRLVLYNVPWPTYLRLLQMFDESHVRMTYDRGTLEIMTLTFGHESYGYLLGRFIDALTEELGLPIAGGGSTTFKRRRRGLEPDGCFWIANEPRIRGKTKIDLRVDPPPDLAIEVDVSHSSLDRMSVYAALGVPEVCRLHGQTLTFQVLGPDGKYAESSHSRAFPQLTPADLASFLALRGQTDDNAIVRQFRAWVRQHWAGGGSSQPAP